MRSWWSLIMLAGAVACAPASLAAPEDPDAKEILLRSLRPAVASYVGEQVSTQTGGKTRPRNPQRQKVYRKGDVLRIEFVGTGQVLFDDGAQSLFYFPRQKLLERGPSRQGPARVVTMQRALKSGRAGVTRLPDDSVAGRPAYVLQVAPRQGPTRRVWVDRVNFVQLRMDEAHPDGRAVSTYFTEIDFQQEPPAAKLAFTPPPGTQEGARGAGRPVPASEAAVLARAWGGLLEAKNLPPDYALRGYYRHTYRNQQGLVAVYARSGTGPGPKQTISLFQGPSLGMAGMARTDRRLKAISARKKDADVILVGPLPVAELQKVMDSVAPM